MCKFFINFVLAMSNYKERGRMELAMLYFPQLSGKKAWSKLKSWIELCQPLAKELAQLGYTGRQRTFTPRQVNRIVHYLGEYGKIFPSHSGRGFLCKSKNATMPQCHIATLSTI